MRIKTERLVLRTFKLDDDVDLFDMCSDPNTAYDAGWKPHTDVTVSRNVVMGYMYNGETFAITKDDHVIGTISLYKNTFRKNVNCRELGFCLNKKYRGLGYMSEAIEAVLHWGFDCLLLDQIMVCHHQKNTECERVIKKFPFVYEGTLRMYRALYNGDIIDGVMYSMTKKEFEVYKNERIETKI